MTRVPNKGARESPVSLPGPSFTIPAQDSILQTGANKTRRYSRRVPADCRGWAAWRGHWPLLPAWTSMTGGGGGLPFPWGGGTPWGRVVGLSLRQGKACVGTEHSPTAQLSVSTHPMGRGVVQHQARPSGRLAAHHEKPVVTRLLVGQQAPPGPRLRNEI